MVRMEEESSEEEYGTVGYISIKDYAYDDSNPLHYGYFEGRIQVGGRSHVIGCNKDAIGEVEANNERSRSSGGEHQKQQSVIIPNDCMVNRRFVALYDFVPENDNELELREGDVVYVSYKHGQGWLVAEDIERTKTGLVPEEYVSVLEDDDDDDEDEDEDEEEARPFYLTQMITQNMTNMREDDWEDIEEEEDLEVLERSIRDLGK